MPSQDRAKPHLGLEGGTQTQAHSPTLQGHSFNLPLRPALLIHTKPQPRCRSLSFRQDGQGQRDPSASPPLPKPPEPPTPPWAAPRGASFTFPSPLYASVFKYYSGGQHLAPMMASGTWGISPHPGSCRMHLPSGFFPSQARSCTARARQGWADGLERLGGCGGSSCSHLSGEGRTAVSPAAHPLEAREETTLLEHVGRAGGAWIQ